jgi:hypothetical protein
LPRLARDKHRENSKNRDVVSQEGDAPDHIFDGPGGALAKARTHIPNQSRRGCGCCGGGGGAGGAAAAGKHEIRFDEEEKWNLQCENGATTPAPPEFGSFDLLPVAIHEVGHVLGSLRKFHLCDAILH